MSIEHMRNSLAQKNALGLKLGVVGLTMAVVGFLSIIASIHVFNNVKLLDILGAIFLYAGVTIGVVGFVIHILRMVGFYFFDRK